MIGNKTAVCHAMVKNEADIIEIFIRHNLSIFDHIFITDNNSRDRTVFIVESLIKEGLPITLWNDYTLAHEQSKITTEAYHKIATLMDFDLFFPLDADELITISSDFKEQDIQNNLCYLMIVNNYVVTNEDDSTINMTRRLKKSACSKIFINHKKDKCNKIEIHQGNHGINLSGLRVEPLKIETIIMNHFGNRGINHYLSKYIIGSQAMIALHDNYLDGKSLLATHWFEHYDFIKQREGNITFTEYINKIYGVNSVDELNELTVEDSLFNDIKLKYSPYNNRLIYSLITNYESLSKEYWSLKKRQYIKRFFTYLCKRAKRVRNSINKKGYKIIGYFK